MSITSLKNIWLTGFLALVTFISFNADSDAQTIIGTGDSSSYLVIEADDFGGSFVFEYRYTYDSLSPLNSYDLLTAIGAAQTEFSFSFVNYGDEESPNYFLNAISYFNSSTSSTITLTSTPFPLEGPYWTQWASGGESGYPEAEPIAEGTWTYGSGISSPYRYIQPGSWDGYTFSATGVVPSITPVPEPSSFLLILAAGGVFYGFIRKRRATIRL